MISRAQHDRMANAIRALAMDAIEQAQSGHPGLPLGAADIATVLFTRALKFDASDPKWLDRDRFLLSLPMFPELTDREVASIAGAVASFCATAPRLALSA